MPLSPLAPRRSIPVPCLSLAFVVGIPDTFLPSALRSPLLLGAWSHLLLWVPAAPIPCLPLTGVSIASMGPVVLPASSAASAPTSMAAAFVVALTTVLAPALHESDDPCQVVTPLDADALEGLLCQCDLLDAWWHVLDGIRNSFDMGASAPLSRSFLF